MSIRGFGKSRAVQVIAGTACVLGFGAFLARMVAKVQSGHGVDPYITFLGYPAYPVAVVTLAAVLLPVWGVTLLILRQHESRRRPSGGQDRRHGRSKRAVR